MTWLNNRQRNDLDNWITGHYGEDQFKNERREDDDDEPEIDEDKFKQRLQDEVKEATEAVDRVLARHEATKRTIPEWERDIAWAHLGWVQEQACKKKLRQQRVQTACKCILYTMGGLIVLVTILVALR